MSVVITIPELMDKGVAYVHVSNLKMGSQVNFSLERQMNQMDCYTLKPMFYNLGSYFKYPIAERGWDMPHLRIISKMKFRFCYYFWHKYSIFFIFHIIYYNLTCSAPTFNYSFMNRHNESITGNRIRTVVEFPLMV